mmetsp:Transcript_29475/g.71153  ORF Transcript_29475/g.71153 Transcript_29475/m.71153 type:complete len:549 (+) Transcript_29475:667-2313(+)
MNTYHTTTTTANTNTTGTLNSSSHHHNRPPTGQASRKIRRSIRQITTTSCTTTAAMNDTEMVLEQQHGHSHGHTRRRRSRKSTMASISFASTALVLLLLLSLSTTQPSYRQYVSSFQLYRQQHHSQHYPTTTPTISTTTTTPYSYRRRQPQAPRPSSTLVTTRQQTASLHAPSSSSTSTLHSPFKILKPLVHKDLNELEHLNEFNDDYDDEVDEEFQLDKKRGVLIDTNSNIMSNIYEPATSTSVQQRQQRQSPLLEDREAEYQRRRDEWAHRYTRVQGLRDAFGNNKNGLWGDLDAKSTRRLYKTLLPNALCELIMDLDLAYVKPEDLAPLAYKARKAAKLYARERCHLPTRIMAQLFDGLRALRTCGKFQPQGLTYSQIWDKYQRLILEDVDDTITEEEIVARTCLKIMERSCKTNAGVDRLFLKNYHHGHRHHDHHFLHGSSSSKRNSDLQKITQTLESDVRKLLDPFSEGQQQVCRARGRGSGSSSSSSSAAGAACQRPHITPQQYHALKHFALARRQQQLEAFAAAARYNSNNARAKAAPSKQ